MMKYTLEYLVNGLDITSISSTHVFPAGEIQVKLNKDCLLKNPVDTITINVRCMSGDDIMAILLIKNALDNVGIRNVILNMPYCPYSRQDRICDEGEAFSLKVFANLINSANFSEVRILDAHSDVTPALINNCINISPVPYIEYAVHKVKEIYSFMRPINIVSPDAGANKKINKIYEALYTADSRLIGRLVKCDKVRDIKTGMLSGIEVFADDLEKKPCLIIDDICSYGGTFKGIAKALKEKNAGPIYLYVSHYEGVADVKSLLEAGIEKIFTTNSFGRQGEQENYVEFIDLKIK